MIPGGYILQPRCFDKSDASHFSPVTRELWFYLLRNVNHKDNGKYQRGKGFFNFGDIQNDLSWFVGYRRETYSKPQITKSLQRLCEANMIETIKATRGLIVIVLNYSFYQDPDNYSMESLQEFGSEDHTKNVRREFEGNGEGNRVYTDNNTKSLYNNSNKNHEGNDERSAKEMVCERTGRTKNKNDKNVKKEEVLIGEKISPCPHQKIISLYNEKLPLLNKVKETLWNGARAKALVCRWREDKERQTEDWWENLFISISHMPFLNGKNDRGWKADMGWILKSENFTKILEGKYPVEDFQNTLSQFDCDRCEYKMKHKTTCWQEGRKTCASFRRVEV